MKSLITASVLAVTLSGCRDHTPITTTRTAPSAAKIKSKRGTVPVPLDRATVPLRPSPRERDAEAKKAALSHAVTKQHSGPDGAHAPAPGRGGGTNGLGAAPTGVRMWSRGPMGSESKRVASTRPLVTSPIGSAPTFLHTRIADSTTTRASRNVVVPLVAATLPVGGSPAATRSASPAADPPRLPSIPSHQFLPTSVAPQAPVSPDVGLPQGSSPLSGSAASNMANGGPQGTAASPDGPGPQASQLAPATAAVLSAASIAASSPPAAAPLPSTNAVTAGSTGGAVLFG